LHPTTRWIVGYWPIVWVALEVPTVIEVGGLYLLG
jgi:hypothetical protein